MFNKIFGKKAKKPPVRDLNSVQDLQKGDAFRIGFDVHPEISDKEFFVQSVSGLDLAAKTGFERRVFHLGNTDDGRELIMWVDEELGPTRLAFAYCANQPHVEEMVTIDQFAELFAPGRDYLVELDANPVSQGNPWLAAKYTEDQAKEVYWLESDPKLVGSSDIVSNDETICDYYRLVDQTKECAIEAFVFSGGKTDVYFVNYLPTYKIEELMPAG